MDIRKKFAPKTKAGTAIESAYGEYIYFKVSYNSYRDTVRSCENEVTDKYIEDECECVLRLPDGYSEDGEPTPLVLFCHGAGGRVSAEDEMIGGLFDAYTLVKHGFAMLDVNGSTPSGLSLGCPEHICALYKAYRYAIRHYNLSERVLVGGASMGGTTAMNFINTYPSVVLAAGLFYPRINIDGVWVGGHYCIGTWDKTEKSKDGKSTHDRVREIYRFPEDKWCEENTIGFNPYRTRSFVNADGERVVIPPCPIKIWQGDADTTVDPVMIKEFVRSVHRGGCYIELHMLKDVAHSVVPVMRDELALWFERFC